MLNLPENVTFEEGCIIPDAVSTAYHALVCRGKVKFGDKIVVIGCGGLGIHAIKIASLCGAWVIAVDISNGALENAKKAGADEILSFNNIDPRYIKKITNQGADVAFEFVGNPSTVELAVKCLRVGGRAVVVGMTDERISLISQRIFAGCEFELVGSLGSHKSDVVKVLQLVSSEKLDVKSSITHRFKLENVMEAIQTLKNKQGNPIRVVLSVR